jgi:hypothetical protein
MPDDTDELLGVTVIGKVGVRKNKNGEDENRILAFRPYAPSPSAMKGRQPAPSTRAEPQAAAPAKTPAWRRKPTDAPAESDIPY